MDSSGLLWTLCIHCHRKLLPSNNQILKNKLLLEGLISTLQTRSLYAHVFSISEHAHERFAGLFADRRIAAQMEVLAIPRVAIITAKDQLLATETALPQT